MLPILPPAEQMPIVAASLFKNGYAVVTREFAVGKDETTLQAMPRGALGTVWFLPSPGLKIERLTSTTQETNGERDAATLDEVIQANKGKRVRLLVQRGASQETLSGDLMLAAGQVVMLRGASDVALPKSSVLSIEADGGKLLWKVPNPGFSRVFTVKASGEGKIQVTSLERGLTWAPAYAVDLKEGKTLQLTGKATIINDLDNIAGRELRLVTGFPNVPFAQFLDPFVSGQDVDSFVGSMGVLGAAPAPMARAGMMTQNAGGFGGGGGRFAADFSEAMATSPLAGEQKEDLFFYRQPNVDLKRGDRGYFLLFSFSAPYEEVFTWDIDDLVQNNVTYVAPPEGPGEIWHTISFVNKSGQPLTTAPSTVYDAGDIVGQDTMKYVSPNAKAELKVNKSLDIAGEIDEEEVSRERAAIKYADGRPIYDLVTIKGTVKLVNRKKTKVSTRVRKDLTGEVVATEGNPVVTATAKGLRSVNPQARIVWTTDLDAGQTLTRTYTYKLYVAS
ncbi:hypothetical protein EON81_11415 [bacterium]|nr:MAG: hypothetical protein EON81_11415 [bacterium]